MNPNSNILDKQLARLADETRFEERFEILKTLVEYWHGEIQSEDGFTENELSNITIPTALKKWFLWAGKRKNIMSGQNFLLDPSVIDTSRNPFLFYHENQYSYQWATTLESEDPPVYGRVEESEPWLLQNLRLSEHLILTCLFEAILSHAKFGAATAWLAETEVDAFKQQIPALALPPWTWLTETRLFAGGGRFMCTMENGEDEGLAYYSVWLGAKTEEPLQCLKPLISGNWDYSSL